MIVLPINISFHDWASQIRWDLPNIIFPVAEPVSKWMDWASQVINDNALSDAPIPTKLAYPQEEDWRKWAAQFINNLYKS